MPDSLFPLPPVPSLKTLRETPAMRLNLVGAPALSTLELVGAVLGNPDAALAVLSRFPTLGDLARANLPELEGVRGVGPAGAARIKAALELGKRLLSSGPESRPQITCPADAAYLLMGDMAQLGQEHMVVLLLDTRNRVLSTHTIYKGNLNSTIVRVGELFREAIRANCAAIILAHNHPSGDPSPSPEDVAITREAVSAGKLLSIEVLDHLVIGANRHVSLKERGLGFS